jgi:hypothetical protein
MATRQTTLLLKRSNVIEKIPPLSGLTLGEMALNTADAKLYTLFTSGTTGATEVRQIGWDRVSKTGDTISGNLIINGSISATTYQNLPVSGLTPGNSIAISGNNGNFTISFTGATGGDYLPLSGGTVSGNTIFTSGLTATTLSFNTSYSGTTPYGTMSWNTDFGVPQVGMIGGNVIQKVGESVYAYVKNVDTTPLTKGEVVYIFGASGDKLSVKRASSTGDTTSSKTLGVVAETIAVNGLGYVITQGTLDGLDLGTYTAGDIVWLSRTPGQFTKTKEYAPNHLVFVGVIQRANNGNGQLYVKPQNGYELEELHNVATTGATMGDLLIYSANSGDNLWVNSKTLPGSYTITGDTSIGGNLTVSGNTSLQGLTATTISATTYQNLPISGLTPGSNITITGSNSNFTISASISTGPFGVSNTLGVYTYYSTLSAAMSAATTGQTIEMFADVTATTTVTLKPNVILYGNGHTYTYSGNTGNVFSTSPGSGTYFFYNMNIRRSNTATSTGVIFSADGTVFATTLTFKCYNLTVTYTTTTGTAPIVTTTGFGIYGWVFDGIEVIGNSSGFLFPDVFSVNNIRNSRIENTGTGGGYSTANITGGSVIENTYVKTVSGVAISLNYSNQGDTARDCTVITTSSNGIVGGTAINCYSFSNSGRAITSSAFNCVASTVTGIAYYQSNAWNSIGTSSSTGVAVRPFFTISSFYDCTFRSAGNATISDTTYPARFYNCSIENAWNNASGHGILLNGAGVEVTNCSISVTNASANCIVGAGSITVKYANNSFRGATTPININVTQGITNTHDNQGNILI